MRSNPPRWMMIAQIYENWNFCDIKNMPKRRIVVFSARLNNKYLLT